MAKKITVNRTREQDRAALRKKVRMFYDLQRLRMQCAGRTAHKGPDNEVQLHEVDQAILDRRAKELLKAEKDALKDVKEHLKTLPAWKQILEPIRGIGPTMGGVILAEFDIHREERVSQMWSFAGLAPIAARRCKTCSAVVEPDGNDYKHPKSVVPCVHAGKRVNDDQTFASGHAARPKKGETLRYNAFLKTKLVGVLADSLIKSKSEYTKFYYDYKQRKESAGWGRSQAHRHRAALRYMIKMLLIDIHTQWRQLEGLPVRPSYQEEYLGHKHHA